MVIDEKAREHDLTACEKLKATNEPAKVPNLKSTDCSCYAETPRHSETFANLLKDRAFERTIQFPQFARHNGSLGAYNWEEVDYAIVRLEKGDA
jgi:hypothetical protein